MIRSEHLDPEVRTRNSPAPNVNARYVLRNSILSLEYEWSRVLKVVDGSGRVIEGWGLTAVPIGGRKKN